MARQGGNVVLEPVARSRGTRKTPERTVRTPRASAATTILEALPSVLIEPQPAAPRADPARQGPSIEEIRLRAYQIYQARGCRPGHDVEDWLQAERDLQARPTL